MRIAIVGSGISGLTCGYLLHRQHEITLFESDQRIGGHTHTFPVEYQGQAYAIDTGFIVFNDWTYPLFQRLLARIGISAQPTEMSFAVSAPESDFEYNGHNLDTLFAKRQHLLSPRFYLFVREILRFNREAKLHLSQGRATQWITLGDYLQAHGYSSFFARHYILPMGAAIWSSSLSGMRDFPLHFFLQFFNNHGLLNIGHRPQWHVLPGGSSSYIAPLTQGWRQGIHTGRHIQRIYRHERGVRIEFADHAAEFDAVILACHSDQALALLGDASEEERRILGAIGYRDNQVWLHTDTRLLPRRPKAWASWNYLLTGDEQQPAAVTYNMNRLQGITAPATFCVTLNRTDLIDEAKVLAKFVYQHPVFDPAAIAAQQQREQICGQRSTHFCGAYWYNGFHEDGVRSAVDVCRRLGEDL